jgi:polar amino acid transport system substrate-binding protein
MVKVNIATVLALLAIAQPLSAQTVLKIGVSDSDGPPIAVVTESVLTAGVSWDVGQLLAQEMQVKPAFVVISRKRVEWSLEKGRVDIVCNANPAWYGDAAQLKWTRELFPQIEKIATLNNAQIIRQLDDLNGQTIATIHGYTYPTLTAFWSNGRGRQITETRLDLMMKALSSKLANAAVVSELEFSYWSKRNPEAASQIRLQPFIVTSVPTMCALSPQSSFRVEQLDQAIDHLNKTGQLKTMLRRYQWQPK